MTTRAQPTIWISKRLHWLQQQGVQGCKMVISFQSIRKKKKAQPQVQSSPHARDTLQKEEVCKHQFSLKQQTWLFMIRSSYWSTGDSSPLFIFNYM